MVDWNRVQTIFLDMDGTLLDLHYDNFFWLTHVPLRYAEKNGLPVEHANILLTDRYQKVAGTMQWYCVDYWSQELGLDIAELKSEVAHLIAVHPDVPDFLAWARNHKKRLVLLTNAHQKSLSIKMQQTRLHDFFDRIMSAHDIGIPKEDHAFWDKLQLSELFDPETTLLVDDSLPVLRSARQYGIQHLLAVYKPDSQQPEKNVEEFDGIRNFRELMA